MTTGAPPFSPVPQNPAAAAAEAGPKGWDDQDLAGNVHANADKAARVRGMFAAIAPAYDLNNRLHSMWRDQAWRRFAVRAAEIRGGETVVDVACGTGDLSLAFARAMDGGVGGGGGAHVAGGKVIGIDFTAEMLDIARAKKAHPRIRYEQGDAQNLQLPDACADVVSIAFGIRNVQEVAKALREFRRILRPGGRLVILEFSEPRNALMRWFNGVYCRRIMPVTATIISGDKSGAYKYLPKSVASFSSPEELATMARAAGFGEIRATPLTMGICTCTVGRVGG
jgi:demethylmenaquinone methyltransferase/2-methoxy-6-polyprenyl-1,4-benzoquinol methylase